MGPMREPRETGRQREVGLKSARKRPESLVALGNGVLGANSWNRVRRGPNRKRMANETGLGGIGKG